MAREEDELETNIGSSDDDTAAAGSFFIPGITGRARCLTYARANSAPIVLVHYLDPVDEPPPLKFLMRRRSSMSTQKDPRFEQMMRDLKEARKNADKAREKAVHLKKRCESDISDHSRNRDAVLRQLRKYGK